MNATDAVLFIISNLEASQRSQRGKQTNCCISMWQHHGFRVGSVCIAPLADLTPVYIHQNLGICAAIACQLCWNHLFILQDLVSLTLPLKASQHPLLFPLRYTEPPSHSPISPGQQRALWKANGLYMTGWQVFWGNVWFFCFHSTAMNSVGNPPFL